VEWWNGGWGGEFRSIFAELLPQSPTVEDELLDNWLCDAAI